MNLGVGHVIETGFPEWWLFWSLRCDESLRGEKHTVQNAPLYIWIAGAGSDMQCAAIGGSKSDVPTARQRSLEGKTERADLRYFVPVFTLKKSFRRGRMEMKK
jgi:hypothetical protein